MKQKYILDKISNLRLDISPPSVIFLKGDLGAGKTTLSKHIIGNILGGDSEVTSPTYTYYNKYSLPNYDVYHFDLYRISDYEEFIHIGGEEILDNNEGIILIEWPQILESNYKADIEISLNHTGKEGEREISVIKKGE